MIILEVKFAKSVFWYFRLPYATWHIHDMTQLNYKFSILLIELYEICGRFISHGNYGVTYAFIRVLSNSKR